MQHVEGSFEGCAGNSVYFQCWSPREAPRALILMVHGAGEHGGRYSELASRAVECGYALAALDHSGHGKSGGKPGYIRAFSDYIDDLGRFHRHLAAKFPADIPMVLLGHSLGGLIGGLYLLREQAVFSCAAFSGPLVQIDPDPGTVQRALVRILSAVVPRLGVLKLEPDGISRDPAVVERYVNDPLVFHGSLSARLLSQMFAAMDELQQRASELSLPLLVMHGAEDRMTAPAGSRLLHERASSADKTLTLYTSLFHEIFNEPEQEQVFSDLFTWLESRVPT